jgi:hypothetical protein
MSDWVRRACATTLLLAAVLTFAPLLLPPDDDGLPAFNDDDDSDEAPPALFYAGVAALPALAPLLCVPDRRVSIVVTSEARRIEEIPQNPLSSRSPPLA